MNKGVNEMVENRKLYFPPINGFEFNIQYAETDKKSHVFEIDMHTHEKCEIYVNLTGNVSFVVEEHLYPLTRGDVILVRPGKLHHCVYRSDERHTMFWILFDGQQNAELLDLFYGDKCENFISPTDDEKEELIDLCTRLHCGRCSDIERYISFFRLIEILRRNETDKETANPSVPKTLVKALSYIEQHIYEPLQVSKIAEALHYSESTLERLFKEYLKITLFEFIRKKKMILAATLLREGKSVLDVGLKLGYADNSHFIKLFRKYYGVTPLQYKKM
jgi:AraC-like DNA-binding protein/quercetin dioxygenase-like cupin family protein